MKPRSWKPFALTLCALALTITKIPAQSIYTPYAFTNLAGDAYDSIDGTGRAARFQLPSGVAVDSAGTVYVADKGNNTIRQVTPAGVVTTLAGLAGASGTNDGMGNAARFSHPNGLAVDSAGNIYVADTGNNTIRQVTPGGAVTTLAGLPGVSGTNDGTGSAARFNQPWGVAVDSAGAVYVADTYNQTIRKITLAGTDWAVTTLAGSAGRFGTNDGTGSAARFNLPEGVTVDNAMNIYVADTYNGMIRKVTPAGVVTTLTRQTSGFGVGVDTNGNVYVSGNDTILKVTPAGVVTTLAGLQGAIGNLDGAGGAARFSGPSGVAVDANGNIYVADTYNDTIRKVTPAGVVTTLAGLAGPLGSADGTGNDARFDQPFGVGVDTNGNVYVADTGNHTIRRVTPGGVVTTLAGKAGYFGNADGSGSAARFYYPNGVAADGEGNIYVADTYNNTIRKVTPVGTNWHVTTLAGGFGTNDGIGKGAGFYYPSYLAVDSGRNIYVGDTGNNTIRKVAPVGTNWVVTTLAGLAGSYGTNDGMGSAARFYWPNGVAVDTADNIYVGDYENGTIRKVTPVGTNWVVTTVAGRGRSFGSADGTGSDARFSYIGGVAVDSAGNVYVADVFNQTIRRVTQAGVVTTLAGLPGRYGKTDGWGNAARFWEPWSVAVDTAGNVYVADKNNQRITKGVSLTSIINAPSITCASNSTVECGTITSVSAQVSDTDGNDLIVVWLLNGTSVQTNAVAGSTLPGGTNVSFSAVLPLGTNVLAVTVSDAVSNSASCSTLIQVVDTTAPVIHSVTADPKVLWPPNHKMVPIRLKAVVTDACGPITWKIIGVTSNEAANAEGSGQKSPDWEITGDHTLTLRAERSGKGGGRVYTMIIQATDLSGNKSQGTVAVTVARERQTPAGEDLINTPLQRFFDRAQVAQESRNR